jgi:hypothetical protein
MTTSDNRLSQLEEVNETLRSALVELVELKDMKDRIERHVASGQAETPEIAAMRHAYARRKPLAWARARAVSTTEPEQSPSRGTFTS